MNRVQPRGGTRGSAGLSLVEVMVAVALLTVVLMGLMGVSVLSNRQVQESNDRAVAHAAAQLTVEMLGARSVTEVLAFDDTTFDVEGLSAATTKTVGRIDVTDLAWDGSTNQAYLVSVRVADPNTGQEFAAVSVVRAR